MIPITLQIKNFLSYGPLQTINFGSYPLICLAGKNGHGKSALLDALTWALWGQARKVAGQSKADEGLLRLGQTEMMVCLDFSFNGQTYRVRREFFHSYGKSHASLDFALLDPQQMSQAISLTDKTIRATQAKIEAIIGLDYDSFINSAFLRQGQSNEFSKKSAKERKEILATILGLNRFEELRKLALEKVKQAIEKKELLTKINERIINDLAQSNVITEKLSQINASLVLVVTNENEQYKNQSALIQQKNELIKQQQQYALLSLTFKKIEQQEHEGVAKLRSLRTAWSEIHHKQLHLPDLAALEKEKNNCAQIVTQQTMLMQKNLELKERYLISKESEQQFLQKKHADFTTQLHEKKIQIERATAKKTHVEQLLVENKKQHAALEQEGLEKKKTVATLMHAIATLEPLDQQFATMQQQFDKRKNYYQQYITQGNWIKSELDNIIGKQKLSCDENDPSCPLCEQNLSASRKRFLKLRLSKQEQFLQHRLQRLSTLIANLKVVLREQHAQLGTIQQKIDEKKQHLHRAAELEKIVATLQHTITENLVAHEQIKARIDEAAKELERATQESSQFESAYQPANDPAYQQIVQQLGTITDQIKNLGYDNTAHQRTLEQLSKVEAEYTNYQQLAQAITLQHSRREQIRELIKNLKAIKHEKNLLIEQQIPFKEIDSQMRALEAQELFITQELKKQSHEKERILQEKGSLENQQRTLQALETEYAAQKKNVDLCNQTIESYQAIAVALGKDGIQALLIEEAIPEIEQEANRLLSKLTDNQAHIFIESVRDLKKGGTKETLDIKISDAIGIRPYELFSGGEAFRIDFSLRIAISKLLTRRAGTSLQTLIIDEGFGSQDEDGLNHIMDVLHKIQDDFEKIIIVSHLNSMKDQFPVHFMINKGPQGTSVSIMEQG